MQSGRRRIIVGVNLASFALIFESSALTVALPALAREWRAPLGTMQWVADASLLTSALLLLFAGRRSRTVYPAPIAMGRSGRTHRTRATGNL